MTSRGHLLYNSTRLTPTVELLTSYSRLDTCSWALVRSVPAAVYPEVMYVFLNNPIGMHKDTVKNVRLCSESGVTVDSSREKYVEFATPMHSRFHEEFLRGPISLMTARAFASTVHMTLSEIISPAV